MQFANGETNEKQIVGVDNLKFWLQGDLDTSRASFDVAAPPVASRNFT